MYYLVKYKSIKKITQIIKIRVILHANCKFKKEKRVQKE